MIYSAYIYKKANNLVFKYGTRDVVKLAAEIGVDVQYSGSLGKLLGMYVYRWQHRAIFLNTNMDEYLTQMVCGHELGHDTFHRNLAKGTCLHEFELFRMKNTTEYEANAFAAHLLIDTDECLEYARNGYDVVQTAQSMNSEINLMLIKLQELNRMGYNLSLPMEPQNDFLRNISVELQ